MKRYDEPVDEYAAVQCRMLTLFPCPTMTKGGSLVVLSLESTVVLASIHDMASDATGAATDDCEAEDVDGYDE